MPKRPFSKPDLNALRYYAENVDRFVSQFLDETEASCECCGKTHYANWTEAQAATELRAVARKLRKWSYSLAEENDVKL